MEPTTNISVKMEVIHKNISDENEYDCHQPQKIKCAEISRYVKSKKWEFECFSCNEIYDAPLQFVLHLETHFDSDTEPERACVNEICELNELNQESNAVDMESDSDQPDMLPTHPKENIQAAISPASSSDAASPRAIVTRSKKGKTKKSDINSKQSVSGSATSHSIQENMWVSAYYKKKLQHQISMADDEPVFSSYSCDTCQETFSDKFGLAKHFSVGHKRMQCEYCGKKYNSKYAMSRHLKRHQNKDADDSFFYCKICMRRFKEERSLTFHMRKHDGQEKAYICEICRKTFTRSSTLRVHIDKAHRNHKTFQCPECGKCLASSSELGTHRRVHWVDKPNKCDMCDAQFVYPWQLKEHRWGHTGERPLQCTYCPKTFSRNKLLRQHENIHTGKINYPCRHCSKNFSQAAGRRAHEKHVHQVA